MTIRAILCIGGANWTAKFVTADEWSKVKPTTPFGTLPYLKVIDNKTGEVLVVSEISAIERYLAQKFELLGLTEAEKLQVNVLLSLHNSLNNFWIQCMLLGENAFAADNLVKLINTKVPAWIANCEKEQVKNGSIGHFVGQQITYADIAASTLMDALLSIGGMEAVLNEKTAPNLYAVKRKVDSHPRYLSFRKSEDFKKLSIGTEGFVSGKAFSYDTKKMHVV
ncbi:Glutathione S-transferase S1 [Actinomortierella ambigua]|uniref:Glutathione S-transferase S1 n=1 Tax=Actinomortierella ambigua TaxID=1343610 RepID=A0A9P6U0Y8_9FUNG|nr:Glutathione S-transferase S1 [Actinomortierella ambigua]